MATRRDHGTQAHGPKLPPKATLLLVGPEADTSKVTRILLEKEGYEVLQVRSAVEGAERLQREADDDPQGAGAGRDIHLCLLDLGARPLAKAHKAEKLYDALARRSPQQHATPEEETRVDEEVAVTAIPILFLARSEEEGREALDASGLDGGLIVKPYDKDDLLEQVARLCAGPEERAREKSPES